MDEKELTQEEVWDEIAKPWQEFKDNPLKEVIEFLKNKKGKILDLGCGSGRNFVKGCKIYGTDFSDKMLEYAQQRARKLKIKVKQKKADTTKLPFKDDFFDSAICIAVLHCIEKNTDRKKTLRELFRVMKKGGEALIMVWSKKHRVLKNKERECFITWQVGKKKYPRYTYIFDKKELENLLKEVGFKILKSWEDDKNINIIVKKP